MAKPIPGKLAKKPVMDTLKAHGYNIPAAADALDVSPQGLRHWLKVNNCQRIFVCGGEHISSSNGK